MDFGDREVGRRGGVNPDLQVQRLAECRIGARLPAFAIRFQPGEDVRVQIQRDALLLGGLGHGRPAEFAMVLQDGDEFGEGPDRFGAG